MFGFGKKSKDVTCPFCKSHNVVSIGNEKDDSQKSVVKYICNNCGKEFEK